MEKSLAQTNPRYFYRTPLKEKERIEKRIKKLQGKFNQDKENYYLIRQNDIFLEALLKGLRQLETKKIKPSSKKEHLFHVRFRKRK